jgi:hypothetical protein
MKFEDYDFSLLNESDIREEIIAPFLRYLGYRSGTSANIIREQPLIYPKVSLGRKDRKKDPELRGRADYICEVDRNFRWVIEAKPPVEITLDDIEQAYTYANHPEVRGVYFCIMNGLQLKIYQTNRGPAASPLLEVSHDKLNDSFSIIDNILGPDAIRRDHILEPDIGEPIGKGLRSIVHVTSGSCSFTRNNVDLPLFNELFFSISGGSIERNENQCLIANFQFHTPFRSVNESNKQIGLERFTSKDMSLSNDSSKPTIFNQITNNALRAGDTILAPYNWKHMMHQNILCRTETTAKGILTEQRFHGTFQLICHYQFSDRHPMVIDTQGEFEIHLA